MATDRAALLRLLESVYRGPAWHGASVRAVLRGVTARAAARAPGPGRPTIHQLVLHLAYSRHLIRGRLLTGRSPRFPRPLTRAWWPAVRASFADDLVLLDDEQNRLLEVVRTLPLRRFDVVRHDRGHTLADELLGHVVHDGYHAGQIALARKLVPSRGTNA